MTTNKKYNEIWELAKPYLEKGKMKNFVLHTKGVVKAMELLLQKESGDKDILIPAAILHDVGWAKVPAALQKSNNKKEKIQALKLHIEYAPKIVRKILSKTKYNKKQIKTIIEIIVAHKFKTPIRPDKRLLIDADNLSDVFKEQFYSDAESYNVTPEQNYNFRKNDNTFYTKTAKIIFEKELEKRKQEFKI
ncbi:HD domain-containing protein [Candidatus Parcubacteria bacterium]|nr:HD domain-containing protein [Candidatus Parcubacteria bacterium]